MYTCLWNLRSRTIYEAIRNMSPENPMVFHCIIQQQTLFSCFLRGGRRYVNTAAGGCDYIRRCWLPSLPTSCGKIRMRRWWCCLPHGSQVAEQNALLRKFFHIRKERVVSVMQKCTTAQKILPKYGSLLPYVTIYVNEHDLTFKGKVKWLCDVFSDVRAL